MMPLPHEIFLLEHYYFASARNLLLNNYSGVYGMAVKVSHTLVALFCYTNVHGKLKSLLQ